ncbi:ATP-dependent helicase [Flagellimonas alvinocaridis]|uniref:DNA 3'-5' helicase n=1 Tax=Flagellimonas alvinocaridis TaxID=2530200 RepID=A0A4S8RRQ3_9FLAO|nr:UvrD-helicase domain-containing protein [Allomuricauda alvinocaridis]THV61383.1 ATP-dependent helicase [Allomuricauda alvinocaridis]
MGNNNFKIYSASAGSGKTYALTKEYLKLLLANDSPSKFRQILAITFTNKAVDEMKTRILDNLFAFGKSPIPQKQSSLFNELCHELSVDDTELQQRSQRALKRILHNYSFFEISTIDKFNHKIIKTFARDLHLSQNFEVELDVDLLLEEAVGRLLERAGSDTELTEVLIAFSLEKIDDDKSWNIAYDLLEIGKLLFQENHAAHIDSLRSKSIADFKEIQKKLSESVILLEAKIVGMAQKALQEIDHHGFDASDFPRQTLPNHFKKMVEGEFDPKKIYTSKTLEPNLVEGKILKAADKRDVAELSMTLLNAFLSIKQHIYHRAYLKNIYGNMVPLTLLNEIAKEIKNIELDRDIIPISSLNAILSKEIKDQPVPFIYERMGEKYRHYFIDEFQDTSQMQWENLIPLIGNALESEDEKHQRGSLFLVGDVKQAIYRWRGGRAEQLLDLLNGQSTPFVVEPSIRSLETNWRSCDEIVQFNNRFFTSVAPILQNEAYKNLFLQDSHQKTNNRSGGFVQLCFLENGVEDKEETYCLKTLETLQHLTSQGYPCSDICILVRDNKNGMLLADFLAQNHIPIISSDALLLNNNKTVIFLMALLRIMENPADREAAYHVLLFLTKHETHKHGVISKNLDHVEAYLFEEHAFNMQKLKGQSVSTILESAIVQFELSSDSTAYLTFLMDEALLVEKRMGASIYSFLKYWEQKKDSLSIAAPDNVNAVTIMTVHKSKGLEFPFVIFPFANSRINKMGKKSWVPATQAENDLGLSEFLINTNRDMLEYNLGASEIYAAEEQKSILDAMNVLYVALTRPIKGLYVFTEKGKDRNSMENVSSYADLFQWHLKELGVYQNEKELYSFGEFQENQSTYVAKEETDFIPYVTRPKGDTGFSISTASGRLWDDGRLEAIEAGNLIHYALSQIKTREDILPVVEKLQLAGHFQKDAAGEIQQKLMQVVGHPNLKAYFSAPYEIWNEQEILTVNGLSLRPDRIAILGDQATVIDYKTGKPSPSHKEQIVQYGDALSAMGYKVDHNIIVYIDHEINPIFI